MGTSPFSVLLSSSLFSSSFCLALLLQCFLHVCLCFFLSVILWLFVFGFIIVRAGFFYVPVLFAHHACRCVQAVSRYMPSSEASKTGLWPFLCWDVHTPCTVPFPGTKKAVLCLVHIIFDGDLAVAIMYSRVPLWYVPLWHVKLCLQLYHSLL